MISSGLPSTSTRLVAQPAHGQRLDRFDEVGFVVIAEDAEAADRGPELGGDAAYRLGRRLAVGRAVLVIAGERHDVEPQGGELVDELAEALIPAFDVEVADVSDPQAVELAGQLGHGQVDGMDQAVGQGHGGFLRRGAVEEGRGSSGPGCRRG